MNQAKAITQKKALVALVEAGLLTKEEIPLALERLRAGHSFLIGTPPLMPPQTAALIAHKVDYDE